MELYPLQKPLSVVDEIDKEAYSFYECTGADGYHETFPEIETLSSSVFFITYSLRCLNVKSVGQPVRRSSDRIIGRPLVHPNWIA
jgi:hypothetical protein